MIENQRIKVTTPQCWCDKEVRRPLFSYRGKVLIAIAAGLILFWAGAAQVISELTYQIQ